MSKTRDHAAMEKRRKKAGQLFGKDYSAPEVARRLGVARQVAYRWKSAWAQGGSAAVVSKGPACSKDCPLTPPNSIRSNICGGISKPMRSPTKAWELSLEATAALRRMRRRRLIIAACYTQAELWP